MRRLILLLLPLAVGCFPGPHPLVLAPARADEYAPYRRPGRAIVTGQAFLSTVGGEVRRAAGSHVTLDPATTLAREYCDSVCEDRGLRPFDVTDSTFLAARRTTQADADGRFTFAGVPAGKYLVRTGVTWYVGYELQGGMIAALVDVPDTGTVSVMLDRRGNPFVHTP